MKAAARLALARVCRPAMPGAVARRRLAAAAVVAALPLFSGCAALLVADVVMQVTRLPSNEPHWVETSRREFAYPVADACGQLLQSVERNGRKLVAQDAAAHTLSVSYPFSWLANNWGGTLRITCAATEFGTHVTIEGDGRDTVQRVRAIGDEVLDDLGNALRRQARTL